MPDPTTLRAISGLPSTPASLADSTLIMIDCQNTYTQGVMALDGVADALDDEPGIVPASALQAASLAAIADLFGIVVPDVAAIPD